MKILLSLMTLVMLMPVDSFAGGNVWRTRSNKVKNDIPSEPVGSGVVSAPVSQTATTVTSAPAVSTVTPSK